MIMQVHDELIFEVHEDEINTMKSNIVNLMQNAVKLSIPLKINIGIGENWRVAH